MGHPLAGMAHSLSHRGRLDRPFRDAASGGRLEVLVEPGERAVPGFLGGGLVVAGRRVVMEAVVGALVDMALVRDLRGRELLVESFPARGDAGIELAILGI